MAKKEKIGLAAWIMGIFLTISLLLEFITAKSSQRYALLKKESLHMWIFAGITAFFD